MQFSTSDAARVFRKLEIQTVTCKHHVRGFLVVDGKRVLALHYSNGRKDMPGRVPQLFRQSLHLSLEDFSTLMGCTLSRAEYISILRVLSLV